MTFEDDVALQVLGHVTGACQSLIAAAAGAAHETVKFFGMRGENHAGRQLLQPCLVIGQYVERIGIEHNGALGAPDLPDDCYGRVLVLSQSRTDAHGVEVLALHTVGEDGLLMIHLQHGFWDTGLHDVVVASWGVHCHLAHTTP